MGAIFVLVETGTFVLTFMAYFSVPVTNHSATAHDSKKLITGNIWDLNVLYSRPCNHELGFIKSPSAWYRAV